MNIPKQSTVHETQKRFVDDLEKIEKSINKTFDESGTADYKWLKRSKTYFPSDRTNNLIVGN